MITQEHIHTLQGRHVHDRDGDKIGTAGQVWTDAAGLPTWVSVRTGLFGLNESLVPLQDADLADDRLVVPFDKATVKDAPNVDADHDEPLSQEEVDRLYSYYGLAQHDSYRSYQAGAAAGNEYYAGESGYGRADDHTRGANFATTTDHEPTGATGHERTSAAGYEPTGTGYETAGTGYETAGTSHEPTTGARAETTGAGYETTGTDFEHGAGQGNGRYESTEATPGRTDRPGLRRYVATERPITPQDRDLPGDEHRLG
ncbi:PRC-barrel domain-containing protein [Actinoplanes sp. HUAS TT8]|uniref:PRC-barrel domain-containing protein n=1 Tax=Actinoplanes sp. HUAS TT8 TaxID=3447453 RepID=UPI003F51BF20